jgi:hypothetical protein
MAIVWVFVVTLGRRKLSEREGRVLKLLSGLLMAGLGAVLITNPGWLHDLRTALLLPAAAVITTFAITRWRRNSG